jgi:tRNA-dihydrouridine synthase B
MGVRTARKHIAWYVQGMPKATEFRKYLNAIDDCNKQSLAIADFLDEVGQLSDRLILTSSVSELETTE